MRSLPAWPAARAKWPRVASTLALVGAGPRSYGLTAAAGGPGEQLEGRQTQDRQKGAQGWD